MTTRKKIIELGMQASALEFMDGAEPPAQRSGLDVTGSGLMVLVDEQGSVLVRRGFGLRGNPGSIFNELGKTPVPWVGRQTLRKALATLQGFNLPQGISETEAENLVAHILKAGAIRR